MPTSSFLPAVSISGGVCCNTASAAGRRRCKRGGNGTADECIRSSAPSAVCCIAAGSQGAKGQQFDDNTPSCHSSASSACSRSSCTFHLPLCAFTQVANTVPASSCPSGLSESSCWLPPLSCPAERERILSLPHPRSLPAGGAYSAPARSWPLMRQYQASGVHDVPLERRSGLAESLCAELEQKVQVIRGEKRGGQVRSNQRHRDRDNSSIARDGKRLTLRRSADGPYAKSNTHTLCSTTYCHSTLDGCWLLERQTGGAMQKRPQELRPRRTPKTWRGRSSAALPPALH